ncbi:hypothetical protein SAMN02799630_00735 [Paenibacillus sp. UNCCL117]|uniref:hypothetical protein n=1 Tax=unclassified Paenibacillus TaxID=185978 RepID=UPI000884E6AE|nr:MULTISPECIES: hypothetical protein [unclassified Paenibacillus]SDC18118.1 hypothetical protein SAMN04488602_101534 [Paenibacillus sp. cl123]SFW18143.1 hypothetical protein SAMN02799630_00735 [Paenibacillus sp. UNCCL117]
MPLYKSLVCLVLFSLLLLGGGLLNSYVQSDRWRSGKASSSSDDPSAPRLTANRASSAQQPLSFQPREYVRIVRSSEAPPG